MRKIKVRFPDHYSDKISVIKSLRTLTNCTLKEAVDLVNTTNEWISLNCVMPANHNDHITHLRSQRVEVDLQPSALHLLRKAAQVALDEGRDELAAEILQFLTAEKLRNPEMNMD